MPSSSAADRHPRLPGIDARELVAGATRISRRSVSVSVFAASSTATLAATALPSAFDVFAIDPAFGSGPSRAGDSGSARYGSTSKVMFAFTRYWTILLSFTTPSMFLM